MKTLTIEAYIEVGMLSLFKRSPLSRELTMRYWYRIGNKTRRQMCFAALFSPVLPTSIIMQYWGI